MPTQPAVRIDAKAERGEGFERGRLAGGEIFAVNKQKIGEENQPPVGDDGWLKRAQRSRGGVARIDEGRQSFALALLVQALEGGFGHHHFAAHLECLPLRERTFRSWSLRNAERHAADGADVRGDVFAGLAVAARQAHGEPSVAVRAGLVTQRHAQAVELEFGRIFDGQSAGQFVHAAVPVGQLFGGVGVVEREHGPRVLRLFEALGRLAAHALRRRVGRDQLGMRRFKSLQFVHQRVVLGVGDLGRVENVVEMLVAAQFFAQFFDLALEGRLAHRYGL